MKVSQRWDAYARLQRDLDRTRRVDSLAWGLEAGLDALLADDVSADPTGAMAVAAAARRERHRSATRRHRMAPSLDGMLETGPQLDARAELRIVERTVSESDWYVLCAVGEGADYTSVAELLGVTAASLRVRVWRLRRRYEQQLDTPAARAA